jgi:hypothetical protein
MKKITYLIIALSLIVNSASALEKKDCSGLKKLSKAFIACKSGNLKAGIVNTGNSIKKGTVGKIKKEKKITNENDTNTATKITKKIKEKTAGFKNPLNDIFSGNTKQYPKYSKSKKK